MTLLVTHADVLAFAEASHDRNPLHVDAAYARRTSFGRPVVFGVLGALLAMTKLPERSGSLASVKLEFSGPVFEDTAYEVAIEDKGEKAKVLVKDGARTLLKAMLVFVAAPAPAILFTAPAAKREIARTGEVPKEGDAIDESWAPHLEAVRPLLDALATRGVHAAHVAAMMAASYVVGMELPGAQALFSRLALTFGPDADAYVDAKVSAYDERYRMLTLDVCLSGATGEIRALSRPPPVELDASKIPSSSDLAGKTAVVIGGGRGLGAAIALALAKAGCDKVVATYAGAEESAKKTAALDARIAVVQSDASREAELGRVREIVGREVDILVLSASPAVLPLSLGVATVERALDFVRSSLALVATPLAALPLSSSATLVVISSAYVDDPPEDFSHYVAAKGAIEGLARSFGKDRGLAVVVARPPRVLTDMTNTAFGAEDALPAEDVAVAIVRAAVQRTPLVTTFEAG